MKRKCLRTLKQVCEELGDSIDGELCQRVKEHLDTCPQCCAQVDSMRGTVRLYRNVPEEHVPSDVDERLWKILNLPRPS